eukprot:453576_1
MSTSGTKRTIDEVGQYSNNSIRPTKKPRIDNNNNDNNVLSMVSRDLSALQIGNCDNFDTHNDNNNNNENNNGNNNDTVNNIDICNEDDDMLNEDDDILNHLNENNIPSETMVNNNITNNNYDIDDNKDNTNTTNEEMKENESDHINVIDTVFKGPTHLEDGRSLANCNLGITAKNIRFANKPHPTIQQNFARALKSYQNVLSKINSDSKCIHHILRSRQTNNDISFEFGIYWIYFNKYNYDDRNTHILASELEGLLYAEDDDVYVCKYSKKSEITQRLKTLLKNIDEDFPKSVLAHLGRQHVSQNKNKIMFHCYCKLCDCDCQVEIVIPKKPLLSGRLWFYIQEIFNGLICIHPYGIQKQYKSDQSNLKVEDFQKVGCIFSPILTHQHMITDDNIDFVCDGINDEGVYNTNQLQNVLNSKRNDESQLSSGEIEAIRAIAKKLYLRDLEFNDDKPSKDNIYYYGELHHFQWLSPRFAMLYNYSSLELQKEFVIDLFMDFTEGIIAGKYYNLILSMVNPLGGVLPYPLLEVITEAPTGYTVRISITHYFMAYSIYTKAKFKRLCFWHVDRFKGWIYGIYFGTGYGGHHFQYLLDGVLFMKTMDNKYMLKYWFRICFGECHTMVSLATYTKNLTGSEHWKIKENKWAHSCTIMEIHRHITEALNRIDFLMNLNFMKLSLTRKIIPFDEIKDFKYYGFEDIEKMIQKGIDRNINVSLTKKKNKR